MFRIKIGSNEYISNLVYSSRKNILRIKKSIHCSLVSYLWGFPSPSPLGRCGCTINTSVLSLVHFPPSPVSCFSYIYIYIPTPCSCRRSSLLLDYTAAAATAVAACCLVLLLLLALLLPPLLLCRRRCSAASRSAAVCDFPATWLPRKTDTNEKKLENWNT